MKLSVLDSVLASWTNAIDNAQDDDADVNAALVDSDVSSEKASTDSSDPEAAFLADADFAVAVARAAELSGMTVVGSTIVDSNPLREKGAAQLLNWHISVVLTTFMLNNCT